MRGRGRLFATVVTLCGVGAVTACGGGSVDAGAAVEARERAATPAATRAAEPGGATPEAEAEAATPEPEATKPLEGKVVVLDPGHNGANYKNPAYINRQVDVHTQKKACDTTGTTTNDGYTEAAFNWDIATRTAKALRAAGATVKLTRKDNNGVGPCITERAALGNKMNADAAVSIHADGAGASAHGFHVIMPKKINGPVDPVVAESRRLGIDIRDAIRDGTNLPYSTYIGRQGLDFRNDLGGLNLSTVPKVFVECGNMRNPSDAARFKDPKFRQRLSVALAKGIENYLG